MNAEEPRRCQQCDYSLQADQRYCLDCGAPAASRGPRLEELLRRQREATAATTAATTATPLVTERPAGSDAGSFGLRLPSPGICALLVLVFLGFGIVLGDAASPRVQDTLAASRGGPLRLILPRTSSAPSATSSAASSPPAGEPPAAEPEATPAAGSSPSLAVEPAPVAGANSSSSSSSSSGTQAGSGAGEGESSPSKSAASPNPLPPVKHVFVVMLADQPFAALFGPPSSAPYLEHTLEPRGALLTRYYAVAHQGLADGVALVSGQGPTVETAADCPAYTDIAPATVGADQQVAGSGCVYPRATETLASQLTAKHLTWHAYVEGIDEGSPGPGPCAHPAIGAADPTAVAPPTGESYATFRDPFVYFHSVIDSPACASDVVGLSSLSSNLQDPAHTPSFSYIVPDRCHDASPTPCAPGAPSGPAAADGFLSHLVPEILASKAYKKGGLLIITADQAPSSGESADSSSCCGQPHFPNLPAPSGTGLLGRGGGQVGALLLSPFIKPGTIGQESYNHFELLRTIEDLFGLKHLGYAGMSGASSIEPSLFSAYKPG